MKKLYWYNLIVFGLLVLAPQVFDYLYKRRSYDESILTVQYITSFLFFLGGVLLIYKNIKFFYNKKESNVKNTTLQKIIVSFFIFLSVIIILIGLFFLAVQYGFRHGVGF